MAVNQYNYSKLEALFIFVFHPMGENVKQQKCSIYKALRISNAI